MLGTLLKRTRNSVSFRINRLLQKFYYSHFFYKVKLKYLLPIGIYDKEYLDVPLDDEWKKRIQDVVDCPDNSLIERHPDAGKIKNGKQVMHNGTLVTVGGYYGGPIVQMLYINKGVHEPQEEFAFGKVLKTMAAGATMIELGSYWSFYSIWFNKIVKDARNFMVEPDRFNMLYGINNFNINKAKGKFTNAFVGKTSVIQNGTPVICIDDFVIENNIAFIEILHSDIQGFEYDMLTGAFETINNRKIGYIFISTHGKDVHYACVNFLKQNDFVILCSADEKETYSLDGLIVARSIYYMGIDKIEISLKSKLETW